MKEPMKLTSILFALLLTLITGCTSVYNWTPEYPASEKVIWHTPISQEHLHTICGVPASEMAGLKACAIQLRETKTCHIYSILTEREAMTFVDRDGISLDLHERQHCKGYRHGDMRLSATGGTRK